jgi:hypothetical protein
MLEIQLQTALVNFKFVFENDYCLLLKEKIVPSSSPQWNFFFFHHQLNLVRGQFSHQVVSCFVSCPKPMFWQLLWLLLMVI